MTSAACKETRVVALGALLLCATLGVGLAGCGRYGPPTRRPVAGPVVEAGRDTPQAEAPGVPSTEPDEDRPPGRRGDENE